MRYFRIFLLHFQDVFEQRSRSFVWFLWSILGPFTLILYWRGAIHGGMANWTVSSLTSYYLLEMIIGSICMSHIENETGYTDIQEGQLSSYLLRPFSYYQEKLLTEIPNRLLQGVMGLFILLLIFIFFGSTVTIHQSFLTILLAIIIAIFAYLLAFTLKMILGLTAFWVTDIGGMFQLSEMLIFIFAGYVLPLNLFPKPWDSIAYFLPYGYIVYFPTIAFQGGVNIETLLHIIFMQCLWLSIAYFIYQNVWKYGMRKFSAVGQ
ncbi:MAG TPA: ABC-2 family transporter protein [Candidatus Saccharimonadales bacterium]|nr:ABC-2 family transporter protein [Candidatus Saccharimonadales bacterium]